MRSVSVAGGVAAASVLFAGVLAGCTTTQQTAARQAIRAKRTLAARRPLKVRKVERDVRVIRTAIVRGAGGAAIAATLENTGAQPVNDLPLAVGVRTASGRAVSLNTHGHLPYFQSHIPALAPGAETTWVFTSPDKATSSALAAGSSAFAKVASSPRLTVADRVPQLQLSDVSAPDKQGTVRATVENTTGMPQYDLAIYAWATRGGRYVAAGRTSLSDLTTGSSQTVKVKLIGNPHGASVHVAAPPTIFQ